MYVDRDCFDHYHLLAPSPNRPPLSISSSSMLHAPCSMLHSHSHNHIWISSCTTLSFVVMDTFVLMVLLPSLYHVSYICTRYVDRLPSACPRHVDPTGLVRGNLLVLRPSTPHLTILSRTWMVAPFVERAPSIAAFPKTCYRPPIESNFPGLSLLLSLSSFHALYSPQFVDLHLSFIIVSLINDDRSPNVVSSQ